MNIKKFLEKRIENNKIQFTDDELAEIKNNLEMISKIYSLGIVDTSKNNRRC